MKAISKEVGLARRARWHELGQLFGAYLNEDWNLDYETWEDAVDAYTTGHSNARLAAGQIRELLAEIPMDELRATMTLALGSAYGARLNDTDYAAWVDAVSRRIDRALTQ